MHKPIAFLFLAVLVAAWLAWNTAGALLSTRNQFNKILELAGANSRPPAESRR